MTEENMLLLALVFQIVVQFTQCSQMDIEARCYQDVFLPCDANFSANDYFAVTWYKGNKTGIIRKILKDKGKKLFHFPRNVSIDEQNSLVLLKVTPEDSGRYECAVSANVGGKNNPVVTLTVPECEPEETTVSMTTVETALNRTHSPYGSDSAPPLPLTWSLVGYGAVAVTKVLLSTIIILGFHIWTRRKRRW